MLGVERRVAAAGWAQFGQAPSVEKVLGSLPVVADFCHRLRIREVVDELCPMREVSMNVVSHGQMVEVLVANRLTSPAPLRGVEAWAQEWAEFGCTAVRVRLHKVIKATDRDPL